MPPSRKQQKNTSSFKSSSQYVHPSLETRSSVVSTIAGPSHSSTSSVSERIEYLRRAQAPRASPATLHSLSRPASSPVTLRGRVAGPPPPRSWLEGDGAATRTFKYGTGSSNISERRPRKLNYFPGLNFPSKVSLLHHSIMSMAGDFDWHLDYDHIYMAGLPVGLRMMLLSYIACHGPEKGVSIIGLKTLFSTEDTDDKTTCNDEVDRLDLGGAVGRGLSLRDLGKFWHRKTKETEHAQDLDSWELGPTLASNLYFPALTKLSLAYPGSSVTWSDLLNFSRNLGSLNQLSLAHWPIPCLSSSTIPASPDSTTPTPSFSGSFDLSEAAYLLKLISRNTPSLQYLSLEGCGAWLRALRYDPPPSASRRKHGKQTGFDLMTEGFSAGETSAGVEWTGSWRNLTHLDLGQGWIPLDVDVAFLFQLQNSRGKVDVSFSTMRLPTPVNLTPASTVQSQPRVFPTARTMGETMLPAHSVARQENYTVTAPFSVADRVQAASRRQKWCQQELEALLVENWVRTLRKIAGGKVCMIEHGWDSHNLIEVGYAEEDLFAAGF